MMKKLSRILTIFVSIPWYRLEAPLRLLAVIPGTGRQISTGRAFSYSNGGYVFLGLLVEKKLPVSSSAILCKNSSSRLPTCLGRAFTLWNNLPANTAVGYLEDRETSNIYNLPIRGGGDGGLFTTAEDLRSFWQHLFSHRLLSPELTAVFLQTHYRFNDKSGYGCGLYKQLDDSLFALVGGDAGVGFDSRYLVNHKITASIFFQHHQWRRRTAPGCQRLFR
ncbi:MAG: hypothetical protein IPK53_10730 [bacterium]|nr:hypothetical protein [bacterium]